MAFENRKEFNQWGVNPDEEVEFTLHIKGTKLLVAARLHEFAKYVRRGIPFSDKSYMGVMATMTSSLSHKDEEE